MFRNQLRRFIRHLGIPFGIKNGGATNGSEMNKVYDLLWSWICSIISGRFW